MMINNVVIVDGYTDEPAGLGVPPYIDVYPRYVAGAIWYYNRWAKIKYYTIDTVRSLGVKFYDEVKNSNLLIIISGVTVPGKYLGGTPITLEELMRIPRLIEGPIKILAGPVARFGIGLEGGRVAKLPSELKGSYDLIVTGDVEEVISEIMEKGSVEGVWADRVRDSYEKVNEYARLGAKIVKQHPSYGKNLVVEIETYRGCPRWIVGGCSFCIEPLYGEPIFRCEKGIIDEIKALYEIGVLRFRLGRQPDIYAYKAYGVGEVEFPKPNVEALRRLFHGIRSVAPRVKTLHIDNVNPGTIAHHIKESKEVTKIIVEYHTPGDVAAFGVETADPEVVKKNNLKVYPEEAMEAIRIVNEVGSIRGYNGLPHLLPGINFVHGLIGETKETYRLNYMFLREILDQDLMIRRINIRQVMAFPKTKMWSYGDSIIKKHKSIFKAYKEKIRREIDIPMLKRVVPKGTILREVYTEVIVNGRTYARQPGSYPLTVEVPEPLPLGIYMDFTIVDHSSRSVIGIPYPLDVNKASKRLLKLTPGITKDSLTAILKNRPLNRELYDKLVPEESKKYLHINDK